MKLVTSLNEIDRDSLSLTIGNFDGVHLGHQYVITEIKKDSNNLVLVTFNPHPSEVLSPRKNFLINELEEKRALLEKAGVCYLYEIPFTRDLSTMDGMSFLEKYFHTMNKKINFFIGHDFSFGQNKQDGLEIIEKFCQKHGHSFRELDEFDLKEESISSSQIRERILDGKIKEVNKLLGRDFFVNGSIVKGEGRGKQLGYPTANIMLDKNRILPNAGVYHSSVVYNEGKYKSITNIGYKPTFQTDTELTVETYILDFDKDIYGENLNVFFHEKLRDEIKFDSVNSLIQQISQDVAKRAGINY